MRRLSGKKLVVLAAFIGTLAGSGSSLVAQPFVIFGFTNQIWRYNDTQNLDGLSWEGTNVNDSAWKTGRGTLANEFETAPINFLNTNGAAINTVLVLTNSDSILANYFRTRFIWNGSTTGATLILSNVVDDGAIYFLNGVEIARTNLPPAPTVITNATLAINNHEATEFQNISVMNPASLRTGTNVLAIQVNQNTSTSSDLVFALALSGLTPAPPAFLSSPSNVVVFASGSTNLTAQVVGADSLQWFHEGQPVPRATGPTISFANATAFDAGNYYLRASNILGVVNGSTANVSVVYASWGGTVWRDANSNGVFEAALISGTSPDVVFVVDTSTSTRNAFVGANVGDLNNDLYTNSILDGEISGMLALNASLIAQGLGNSVRVAVVSFHGNALAMDMNPVLAGKQLAVPPLMDANSNGVPDVEEIMRSLRTTNGTEYAKGLNEALTVLTNLGTPPGQGNVVFVSDGVPEDSLVFPASVTALHNAGVHLRAFGAGEGAVIAPLQVIDPEARIFTNAAHLIQLFGTLANPASVERGLAGVPVYLDWNNNGQPDANEPLTLTSPDNPTTPGVDEQGRYAFTNVLYSAPPSGPAVLRHVPVAGHAVSYPAGDGAHRVLPTNVPVVIGLHFGDVPPGAIAEPPVIVVQPASRTVVAGNPAVFAVIASHARTYQWFHNGTPVTRETNALLSIAAVSANDAGNYWAVVANPLGAATSQVAVLTVAFPPGVTWPVSSAFPQLGGSFSITPNVTGTGPFTYRWHLNGVLLPDVTGPTLTLPSVSVADGGVYTVTVVNFVGMATSAEFTLSVLGELRFFAGFPIAGRPGATYRIEYADALGDTDQWRSLTNLVLPFTPYLFVDPASPFVPRRFYRASQP